MRYLIAGLTTLLMLSAAPARADRVKFCFLFCEIEQDSPVDSYCTSYQQVNQGASDAAEIKKMSRAPRVRLTANDVLYLCKCKGWENPICKK